MIPSIIQHSVRSGAERKLFSVFRDAPNTEDWICLHSLGLARHHIKRRGEIDFLLLTRKGIFVLEVKGGRISREGGIWKFIDRYGDAHSKHESPFDQASSSMFTIEKEISEHFKHDKRCSRLLFGYGVMFPDIVFDFTGIEADKRQVYDIRDRRRPITQFINNLAEYCRERDGRKRYAPTKKDIESLANFLRGDFDIVPSLCVHADAVAEQFLTLEKEQYAILDTLEQFPKPRILVQGGAGTGKTLLAVEASKREAQKGAGNILLLCYNQLLANFLSLKIKAENTGDGHITVKSIYSLLNELIESSPLAEELKTKRKTVDQETLYREIIPDFALLALIENEVEPFRSVIVDEAQDMMTQDLLDVIDAYVDGGLEVGNWWFFCDVNNQAAVFGRFDENALSRLMEFGQVMLLPINRRNTKPIAAETDMLARPKVRSSATIDGLPVKYSWYSNSKSQQTILSRILKDLLSGGIATSRITILSPRKARKCCASEIKNLSIKPVTKNNVWHVSTGEYSFVTYSSISAFKGLENDFIILTDIEDLEKEWWRSVVYVGMSRARVSLHVLLNKSLKPIYEMRLRDWLEESTLTYQAGVET
jgi:hypothetical protein